MRLWLCVAALMACGCGGPAGKAEVRGKVTWEGQPIERGRITLFLPKNTPAGTGEIKNGEFSFWSKPGEVTVQIVAERDTGKKDPVEGLPLAEQYIPKQFNQASTLQTKVELGETNERNYDLTATGN